MNNSNNKVCVNCKWFIVLKHNNNFGECYLGISDRDILGRNLSAMFGGTSTPIPLVHKEQFFSCFDCKHPDEYIKGVWLTDDMDGFKCTLCEEEFFEPPNERLIL